MRHIKILIIVIFALGIGIFLYWLKCQEELDIIKKFHVSDCLPVNLLLKRAKIIALGAGPGELLNDNFESNKSRRNWSRIWMAEDSKVKWEYAFAGSNGSRCLLITSKSLGYWSYQQGNMFEIKDSDVFGFEGEVKVSGDSNTQGNLNVILYDAKKGVSDWNYAMKSVYGDSGWVKVRHKFSVPRGVKFIRFRLTGKGAGKVWFDNVRFWKG